MITRRRISSYNNANNTTAFTFFKNYETNNFIFYLTSVNYSNYLASDNDYLVIEIPIFQIYDKYTGDDIPPKFLKNNYLYTSAFFKIISSPGNPEDGMVQTGNITPEFIGYDWESAEAQYYAKIAVYFDNYNKYGNDTIYYNDNNLFLQAGNKITIYTWLNPGFSNIYIANPINPMYFNIGGGSFNVVNYRNINLVENYPIKNTPEASFSITYPSDHVRVETNFIIEEYEHIVNLASYWDSDLKEFFIPSISFAIYDPLVGDGESDGLNTLTTSTIKYINSIDIYFDKSVAFSHNIVFDRAIKLGKSGDYLFDVNIPDFACRVIPQNTNTWEYINLHINVEYAYMQTIATYE